MGLYNVLNELDYYPRKGLQDLNPVFMPRKRWVNEELSVVAFMSPILIAARNWIGSALFLLDHPMWNEAELFAAASEELERLAQEVRHAR